MGALHQIRIDNCTQNIGYLARPRARFRHACAWPARLGFFSCQPALLWYNLRWALSHPPLCFQKPLKRHSLCGSAPFSSSPRSSILKVGGLPVRHLARHPFRRARRGVQTRNRPLGPIPDVVGLVVGSAGAFRQAQDAASPSPLLAGGSGIHPASGSDIEREISATLRLCHFSTAF